MSRAMLERYSHIRMGAKRDAVADVSLSSGTLRKVPVVEQITLVQ
jgi:hypothetical protein